ncbi:MAG: hypothetical protein RML72_06260 [Bacteroidia bacterium]|nr:hypothetical protein [Bacteroidia bacterium]MDW8158463.1 hypothetical protein [Bacteroidia bacterium]
MKSCRNAISAGILAFWIVTVATSCQKDTFSQVPFYCKIESPLLIWEGDTLQGFIPDGWVFQGATLVGAFSLPKVIPLLDYSPKPIMIGGGIWENNDPAYRKIYPFWQFYLHSISSPPKPLDTLHVQPIFYYFADTAYRIPFHENFEAPDLKLIQFRTRNDSVILRRVISFFNNTTTRCGYAAFDSTARVLEITSQDFFDIPLNNAQSAWLEIMFRGNIKFGISLLRREGGMSIIAPLILPTYTSFQKEKWQMAYFYLFPLIQNLGKGPYKLYILAQADGNFRELFIDNVRVLHFR